MDITSALYSGFLGAISMFVFMELITLSKLANADMIRAVGSLITKTEEHSFKVGMVLHLLAGLGFALLYCYILSFIGTSEVAVFIGVGAFGGFVHGLLVSYFILTEGQNRHPLKKYQNAGFEVALAHVVGHVIYGAVIGYTFAYQILAETAGAAAAFSGWNTYQIYMTVIGTLALLTLVALSIKNSFGRWNH